MPRPLRIEYKDAWHHVMNRGANHQSIYYNDSHRQLFCDLLANIIHQFKIEVHAFCLMSNHYHLLIKTPHANLAKAMRYLDGVYTQRFNKLTSRDGSLFRGRYKSILINSDSHLLQVSRYIHLNPVEAKICDNPLNYQWSSMSSYTYNDLSISWLTTSFILDQMHRTAQSHHYLSYTMQGIDEETLKFYRSKKLSPIFGNKKFISSSLNKLTPSYIEATLSDINKINNLPTTEQVLNCILQYFEVPNSALNLTTKGKTNLIRLITIYSLRKFAHASYMEISTLVGNLKPRSISSTIHRIKNKIETDDNVRNHIKLIKKSLAHNLL